MAKKATKKKTPAHTPWLSPDDARFAGYILFVFGILTAVGLWVHFR